jgi:hypothetical protein
LRPLPPTTCAIAIGVPTAVKRKTPARATAGIWGQSLMLVSLKCAALSRLIARRSRSAWPNEVDALEAVGQFGGGLVVDQTSKRAAGLLTP